MEVASGFSVKTCFPAANACRMCSLWCAFGEKIITHSTPALQFLVDTFGADHVLIGTDMPYDMGDPCPVQTVNSLRLTDSERKAIGRCNAAQLFGIE